MAGLRSLRGGRIALFLATGIVMILFGLRLMASLHVNVLWFQSVGYEDVFWRRLAWSWGTRGLVGVLVGALLFLNLRLVARTLGAIQIKRRFGDLEIAEQLPRSYILWGAAGFSALVGLWFGGSVVDGVGIQALLATSAPAWGMQDPVFAHDLSFYVFQLPLLRTAITFAMVVMFLVFAVCPRGLRSRPVHCAGGPGNLMMGALPRVHLGALVAAFLGLIALRLWIGRYLLLLYGTSEVPGDLRLHRRSGPAACTANYDRGHLGRRGSGVLGGLEKPSGAGCSGVGGGGSGGDSGSAILPLAGAGASASNPTSSPERLPTSSTTSASPGSGSGWTISSGIGFRYSQPPGADWQDVIRQLDALPVWAGDPPLVALQQMEARFRYYDFPSVSIDRYPGTTGTKVVALAVREVEPAGIEDPNWQNLHLRERYLSGMGVGPRSTPLIAVPRGSRS